MREKEESKRDDIRNMRYVSPKNMGNMGGFHENMGGNTGNMGNMGNMGPVGSLCDKNVAGVSSILKY